MWVQEREREREEKERRKIAKASERAKTEGTRDGVEA
jgi:hypothetical protein